MKLYLKVYPDEDSYQSERGYEVLSSISAVVDMAHHDSLLYQHERESVYEELFTYLSDVQWEHVYIYNSDRGVASTTGSIVAAPLPWRLLSSPHKNEYLHGQQQLMPPQLKPSSLFPMKSYTSSSNNNSSTTNQSKTVRRKDNVVFFVSNVNNILNSNRFKDWLCDSTTFSMYGLRPLILSPFNEDTDTDGGYRTRYCNVDIIRFAALSTKRAAHLEQQLHNITDSHPDHLDMHFLTAFLSEETKVLLLVNTFGDPTTSLLLKIIRHLRSTRHPVPVVLMDLPNLTIPDLWSGALDGLIAPSRAVGMHSSTTSHGNESDSN